MQEWTGRAGTARRLVIFLHLAENLGLTDDHRVETGSNPKEMLHTTPRFVAIEGANLFFQRFHSTPRKAMDHSIRRDDLIGHRVNFHAVAGRDEQSLRATGFLAQHPIDRRVPGETLPRFDIRGVVADADAKEIHHIEWLCERKVIPQSNVSAALKATTQSAAIERGAVIPR